MNNEAASENRFEWVDFLRGLSALAVVLYHVRVDLWVGWRELQAHPAAYSVWDHWVGWLALPFPFMGSAVMLFFILSGFCIHWPQAGGRQTLHLPTYAVRRFLRIYPPYLTAVVLSVAVELVLKHVFREQTSGAGTVLASCFMLQNYLPSASGVQMVGNPSLWSLPVEMELYLVYPLFWLGLRYAGLVRSLAVVLLVSAVATGLMLAGHGWVMGDFAKYWIIWCSGAVLAEAARTGRIPAWNSWYWLLAAGFLAGAIGAWVAGVPEGLQHFIWWLFYLLVFWWGLANPARLGWIKKSWARPWLWLGTISYSLYLFHFPLFRLLGAWWSAQGGGKPANLLVTLLAVIPALLLAWCMYRLVEYPAHCLGRRWSAALARRHDG